MAEQEHKNNLYEEEEGESPTDTIDGFIDNLPMLLGLIVVIFICVGVWKMFH
jgi:hypothetical protein